MDWLVRDWNFFGVQGQNWMALFAGCFALYIAVLVILRSART